MTAALEQAIRGALDAVDDPEIRRPITELGMVDGIRVDPDGHAHVAIALTIAGCPAARRIEQDVFEATRSVDGVAEASVAVRVMNAEERSAFITRVRGDRSRAAHQFGPDSLTRVIAVTSGKGGVGKSSLTANLATSMAEEGLTVGILDADVFGFSIPAIMGLSVDGRVEQPTRVGDMILPPIAHDVRVISIGMFLGEADPRHTAVSWRGPMLHRTLEQFLTDVWWGDLDALLIDLPPGTGDIAISLGQLLPQAEVIVVTTPQPAAADVAVRSALVARQTGQRVIGVIENMSGLAQPDGSVLELFGSGGGEAVSRLLSDPSPAENGPDGGGSSRTGIPPAPVPLLGRVPLSPAFRELSDGGVPAVLADPTDTASAQITAIARTLIARGRGLAGRRIGVTPSN